MKTVDSLCRIRQVLRVLSGISSVLFWSGLMLLVGSLLLAPLLYVFWDKASHLMWKDAGEIFGLMLAVVDMYILMNVLSGSIKIVDNSISEKIFAQNNAEIMWVIFRRIVYFFGIGFFGGIFSSLLDPVKFGPFLWINCFSDLVDSLLCLGLVYLIALLFGVGVQLQSEIDEVI